MVKRRQVKAAAQPKSAQLKDYTVQLIPAVLFTTIVILVSHMYVYQSPLNGIDDLFWLYPTATDFDFYAHYKSLTIIFAAVLALLFLLYRLLSGSLHIHRLKLYIPVGIYLLLTLLSAVFAQYPQLAWWGADERFEGTIIILCYVLLFFYIVNSILTPRAIKFILYPLTVVVIIASLLGISQALGNDFFATSVGQKFLVSDMPTQSGQSTWQVIDSLAAQGKTALDFVLGKNWVYQTVGNPDYVAFYITLLIPIYGLLFLRESQTKKAVLWAVTFVLLAFNLLSTSTSGGLLATVLVLIFAIVVLRKQLIRNLIKLGILAGLTIIAVLLTFAPVQAEVSRSLDLKQSDASASNLSDPDNGAPIFGVAGPDQSTINPESSTRPAQSSHRFDYIYTGETSIDFSVDDVQYNLDTTVLNQAGQSAIIAKLPEFVTLEVTKANGLSSQSDLSQGGQNITNTQNTLPTVTLGLENETRKWPIVLSNQGWRYRNDIGNLVELKPVAHIGGDDFANFGTGRGYIWERTVPLLADTLIIGHGPDTFALYFPHQDYVARYNYGWDINSIIDKPHNLYLNIAFSSGVLGLLAWLCFVGFYLVSSFKLYRKQEVLESAKLPVTVGAGIFFGVCAFLVAGLVYDDTIMVMPMFYGLLALGVACNLINCRPSVAKMEQT